MRTSPDEEAPPCSLPTLSTKHQGKLQGSFHNLSLAVSCPPGSTLLSLIFVDLLGAAQKLSVLLEANISHLIPVRGLWAASYHKKLNWAEEQGKLRTQRPKEGQAAGMDPFRGCSSVSAASSDSPPLRLVDS